MRYLFVLAMFAAGCPASPSPPARTTKAAAATAYTDGFEVMVLDGKVGSFPLKDAEERLAKPGATAFLADADTAEKDLEAAVRGDKRYPFVRLTVTKRDGGWQEVRLSFHYSLRTIYYDYATDGRRVTPLFSGHRDLEGEHRVVYEAVARK